MKKFISLLLALVMMLSLAACGTGSEAKGGNDEKVENIIWDELEKMGKIESESGLFFVSITLPADFVGSEITQESLDKEKGEGYTTATLNPDGSVTYKMTKKQHKTLLDTLAESFDTGIQEIIDSPDFAFTEVTHNDDFTVFDAHISTEEVGIAESFMAVGFFVYGGIYATFSGYGEQNITVNFYSQSGKLLETVNSSDLK
jgi:hypothetical protein